MAEFVTEPVILDSTGQDIVTALNGLAGAVKPNATEINMGPDDTTRVSEAISSINSNMHNALATGNVANNTDLNNVHDYGVYFMARTYTFTHSPLPSNTWGILIVLGATASDTTTKFQAIVTTNILYFRTYTGGSWGSWYKLTGTAV